MEYVLRDRIGAVSYHRRHEGLSAGEMFVLQQVMTVINEMINLLNNIPAGNLRNMILLIIFVLLFIVLRSIVVEHIAIRPVNPANRDRLIDSFTGEECWHNLRFRKEEVRQLMNLTNFPRDIRMDNNGHCPGEAAFCIMLYRLAYPSRLVTLQDMFGRDYTQISRIFKESINVMFDAHRGKVEGNLFWYYNRFDIYHQSILNKVLNSPHNRYVGFIPEELSNLFGFLDGTGLEIARPGNGAQNAFWNGYLHGHFLIFQGISFPDGMTVIEGAFPGYQPDTTVWRDGGLRRELEALMNERIANNRPRLKIYADKMYANTILITAAHNLRNNRGGLAAWQIMQNRVMSDIRVGVEWAFGKIIVRNKFVSFGKSMFIQNSPVSKYYHIAVLLANAHTCMYGSQQTRYFGVAPPSVEEYFEQ